MGSSKMPVKVTKEFRWEMGHRLPYHESCRNVHGHSYRLVVEIEGELDEGGMVVDFGEISCLVMPILDKMDHAFMVDPGDADMAAFLDGHGLKSLPVPFYSTAENIATWVLGQIAPSLMGRPATSSVLVRVFETASSSAEAVQSRAPNNH